MVDFINFSKLPSKIFITILVVVLNYIIGGKYVFKNNSYIIFISSYYEINYPNTML